LNMSRLREMPPWFGWIFVAFGVLMFLLYLGIIEPAPKPGKRALLEGYFHWQVLCSAGAFTGIGLTIATHKTLHLLARVSGLLGAACLLSVLIWAFFFSNASWPLPVQILAGFCLALGAAGVIGAQVQALRGHKENEKPQNPIDIATTYWKYGRRAQAEAILRQAAAEHPNHSPVFLKALENLKNLSDSHSHADASRPSP
jgi:hypothetical protein